MTGRFEGFDELRELLHALCEESITPEQMQRLERLVLEHPDAEAYYVQYMGLQADLVGHVGVPVARTEQSLLGYVGGARSGRTKPPHRNGRGWARRRVVKAAALVLSAAAAVLIAVTLWPRPQPAPLPRPPAPEATDDSVAVLVQAAGAEWDATGLPTRAGAALSPGWLHLKSGVARIEFYSGAIVILEGPAEFQLVSRTEAFCQRGKLRASVPSQAQGFTVGSPKLDLIDRGTEFGLEVGEKTEVQVFEGKVEVYEAGAKRAPAARQELTTGHALRVEDPGVVKPIASNPAAFLSARQLAERSRREVQLRHKEWQTASAAWRQDPSLLVYYTFESKETWSQTLRDEAQGGKTRHHGAIVGGAWVAGRWPGKQGLEFKKVSDRVRLNVPGEFASLTMAAWVRADALPNLNNSLLMADGWDPGGLHWQIGNNGTVILGVQSEPRGHGAHYHAPEVMTPDRLGEWVHLAVVYDREAALVTHYVDGQPVMRIPLMFDLPLKVGEATLGNWNIAAHRNKTPVRFFSGCIDEFMVFSRALSDQEVERIHKQGNPAKG